MDILRIFRIYNDEIHINVKGSIQEPLYQASHIGLLLGFKNINKTINDYDETFKVKLEIKGNKRVNFLTSRGIYRLIFQSDKPTTILFQSWICEVLDQIRLTGKYELSDDNPIERQLLEKQKEFMNHKILKEKFENKPMIYICRLDRYHNHKDRKDIYKIGYTNNISTRIEYLEKTYESIIVLLHGFECYQKEFESFLYNSPILSSNKLTGKLLKRETKELFLLSTADLTSVIQFIEDHSSIADKTADNEIQTETEEYNEFMPHIPLRFEWKEGMPLYLDNKVRINTKSPWVQKYDPNTLELIESSDSISHYIRQNPELSYANLKTAYKENTIYKGFRWLFVDKNKENIQYTLEPTKHIISTNIPNELIAMIDINKTQIIEVYPSQKHAAESRHFKSIAPITQAIKKRSLSGGHYWMKYNDCSDELKATYTKPLPDKIRKAVGAKKVQIINPLTNEPVRTFETVMDVMKEFQMSRTKLNQVCSNKEIYKNWIFQFVA